MSNNITMPSPGEIAAFVIDNLLASDPTLATNITDTVRKFVGQHCLTDYCRVLPWQGNADLSGRGVSRSTIKLFGCILTLDRCLSVTLFKLVLQHSTWPSSA
jgi:hypothetical protein